MQKEIKLGPQRVRGTIALRAADPAQADGAEDDLFEISFSSEEPYERWWGVETLGHKDAEVDLGWMASGRAPLLVDHRATVDSQVGTVTKAWIENGRGKAVVRFGKSARSQEIKDRVKSGDLSNISVGYEIEELQLVKEGKNAPSEYRVTKWKPYEASIVAIPADETVGVGREAETPAKAVRIISTHNERSSKMEPTPAVTQPPPAPGPAQKSMDEVLADERKRAQAIEMLGARFNKSDLAREHVAKGTSVELFNGILLDAVGEHSFNKANENSARIGLTPKEASSFSFMKAIRAHAFPKERRFTEEAAFEIEASQAYAKKAGQVPKGLLVPVDAVMADVSPELRAALAVERAKRLQQRDLNVGNASQGGYLVSTDLLTGSFIEMLRASMVLNSLGARSLTGLVGDVAIPKHTAAASAYWITSEFGAPTEGQQTLGQVRLNPKTLGAFTDLTRQFMLQASIDVEAFVRTDFAVTLGLAIDAAGISGTGAAGQPQGLKTLTGINSKSFGVAGAPTWAEIIDMETKVDTSNALLGSLGYLFSPALAGKLKGTEKASSTGQFIWEKGDEVNGYRAMRTSQVSTNDSYFGNWAEMIIAMWGGLDLTVDPYTGSSSGTTRIVALQSVDIGFRHPESFTYGA